MTQETSNRARRALFLDRDGVINVDSGYPHRIEEIAFVAGIFDFCQRIQELNFDLVIATNQAGIGRGYYTEETYQTLTNWMTRKFALKQIKFLAIYHCPFHPEGIGKYRCGSYLRKPSPGMLIKASKEHNLDLSHSFLIGDKETDIAAGRAAQLAGTILFLHGEDLSETKTKADIVVGNLGTAAAWLESQVTDM